VTLSTPGHFRVRLTFDSIGSELGHSHDERCLSFGPILVIRPYSRSFGLLRSNVKPWYDIRRGSSWLS
jgi:hypothetical protein